MSICYTYLLYLISESRKEKVNNIIIGSKSANMPNNNSESGKRKLDVGSWCKTTAGERVKFKFAWTIENFTERRGLRRLGRVSVQVCSTSTDQVTRKLTGR